MKKIMIYIALSVFLSCGEYSVNHEVLNEGDKLSGKSNWNMVVGTYLMDNKSLNGLNLAENTKFYLVIHKDSTYLINRYMDDDTMKIVNQVFINKIKPIYFYDKQLKKLDKDSVKYYMFWENPLRFKFYLKREKVTKKPFVMGSYFPDLSYDPKALNDLAYVLKYEKVSDEPMSLEELEKVNKEDK